MSKDIVLVTGATGQVGSDIVQELRKNLGNANVIATDIKDPGEASGDDGPFENLDVLDAQRIAELVGKYHVTQIYHLASFLSAKSELKPKLAWRINIDGLFNVLDVAAETTVQKVFWPSSIAVFGPNSPKVETPQFTTMDPDTVYGISKLAGERWCHHYYFNKGLDVRSLRYPGLISYKHEPGGGTTDYAVEIYFEAIKNKRYECFLEEDTMLPMMYMPDAIKATFMLMDAPADTLSLRSGYNIAGMSFSPEQLASEIKRHIPEFTVRYNPDFRQRLADTWPETICDDFAKADWNWKPSYDIASMTEDMIKNITARMTVQQL